MTKGTRPARPRMGKRSYRTGGATGISAANCHETLYESASTLPSSFSLGSRPNLSRPKRRQAAVPSGTDGPTMQRTGACGLMWQLAFSTGMRQGERFALAPSELDPQRRPRHHGHA